MGPQTYQFRGLLRGLMGSERQTAQPSPAGSAIIKLDAALARVTMPAFERGAQVTFIAPPAGEPASSADALIGEFTYTDAWAAPFAPAHLRAARLGNGDIAITWVRRTRLGGDSWASEDVPLGEETESYRVEIFSGAAVKRTIEAITPACAYPLSDQIADFGGQVNVIGVRVVQMSLRYGAGRVKESVFTL